MHRIIKTKRGKLTILALVAALVMAVAAYAAFLAVGQGSGSGRNVDMVALTVTPSSTASAKQCYPSATAECNIVVDVASAASNPIVTLDKWLITAAGTFTSGNTTLCPNASYAKGAGTSTYTNLPAPVSLAPGATVTLQLVNAARLVQTAPDNCANQTFSLSGAEIVGHVG